MGRLAVGIEVLAMLAGACSTGGTGPKQMVTVINPNLPTQDTPADGGPTGVVIDASVDIEDAGTSESDAPGPYECPGITSLMAVPAEVIGSQPAQLSLRTVGPVADVVWTTSCPPVSCSPCASGTIVDVDGGSVFLCNDMCGLVSVTATLVRSPEGGAATDCADANVTMALTVITCECSGGPACFWPTPSLCPDTSDSGACTCTDVESDPSNCGSCSNACGAGQTCSSGGCVAAPLDASDGVDANPSGGSADAGPSDAPASG